MEHELLGILIACLIVLFLGLFVGHHILDSRERNKRRLQRREEMIQKAEQSAKRMDEQRERLRVQAAAAMPQVAAVQVPPVTANLRGEAPSGFLAGNRTPPKT